MISGAIDRNIEPGRRFQTDSFGNGDKGYIRFVGAGVSAKQPKAVYVGVEFDDATRGKHDGALDGKRFFTCEQGKGAFLHPKRVIPGVRLGRAIKARYCEDDTDINPIDISEETKQAIASAKMTNELTTSDDVYVVAQMSGGYTAKLAVEFAGQQKILNKLKRLDNLVHITVSASGVAEIDGYDAYTGQSLPAQPGADAALPSLAQVFPAVQTLILDDNLLHTWGQLGALCRALPSLRQLSLSHNHLAPPSTRAQLLDAHADPADYFGGVYGDVFLPRAAFQHSDGTWATMQLQVLVLNGVPHAWPAVLELAAAGALSGLLELHVCKTALQALGGVETDYFPAHLFPQLRLLNLSENALAWTEVLRLRQLPVQRLLLNNNGITDIHMPDDVVAVVACEAVQTAGAIATSFFPQLAWLSIADNAIADWRSVGALAALPALTELRLHGNPVTTPPASTSTNPDAPVDAAGAGSGAALSEKELRLLVVASLPGVSTLNLSAVRERERIDAAKLYVEWAWREHKRLRREQALEDVRRWRAYEQELARERRDATETGHSHSQLPPSPALMVYRHYPRFHALTQLLPNPVAAAASKSDEDSLREGEGSALRASLARLLVRWRPSDFAGSAMQQNAATNDGSSASRGGRGGSLPRGSRGGVRGGRGGRAEQVPVGRANMNADTRSTHMEEQLKSFPLNLSIGDLHVMVKKMMKIPQTTTISLWYSLPTQENQDGGGAEDTISWGFELADKLKDLSFYNVENNGILTVNL